MRNSDMPAMPVADARIGDHAASRFASGLTKREYLAALAMQGMLSSDLKGEANPVHTAEGAVQFADALLAELEKSNA